MISWVSKKYFCGASAVGALHVGLLPLVGSRLSCQPLKKKDVDFVCLCPVEALGGARYSVGAGGDHAPGGSAPAGGPALVGE